MGEYGAIAIRPGQTRGKLNPGAVRWRFKEKPAVRPGSVNHEPWIPLARRFSTVVSNPW